MYRFYKHQYKLFNNVSFNLDALFFPKKKKPNVLKMKLIIELKMLPIHSLMIELIYQIKSCISI